MQYTHTCVCMRVSLSRERKRDEILLRAEARTRTVGRNDEQPEKRSACEPQNRNGAVNASTRRLPLPRGNSASGRERARACKVIRFVRRDDCEDPSSIIVDPDNVRC